VKARVLKGGHDVPEKDIRRRFGRSINNFWDRMNRRCTSWILLYNGDEGFQQVGIGKGNKYSIENVLLFHNFINLTSEGKS